MKTKTYNVLLSNGMQVQVVHQEKYDTRPEPTKDQMSGVVYWKVGTSYFPAENFVGAVQVSEVETP